MTSEPMRLIVDAETWLYRAAASAETEAEFQPDKWFYQCDISKAKDSFDAEMSRIQSTCPDHATVMVLGGATNFRYAVYTGYKSNRLKQRRPAGYSKLREWVEECWPTTRLEGVEADDACGIIYQEGDVICSRDKDLMTLPGVHMVNQDQLIDVSEYEADLKFFTQTLTGDATDGYPGLKGVGPVAATKILAGCKTVKEMWSAVLDAYMAKGHGIDYALSMARCARILRAGEYDFDLERPVLWSPPA